MFQAITLMGISLVLTAIGCGGADDSSTRQRFSGEPEGSPNPPAESPVAVGTAGPAPEVLATPPAPRERAFTRAGTLSQSTAPTARDQLCISFDSDGRVMQIDEVTCSPIAESEMCAGDCEMWAYCGGCLMHLEQDNRAWQPHGMELAAHSDGECTKFAGRYHVASSDACSASVATSGNAAATAP